MVAHQVSAPTSQGCLNGICEAKVNSRRAKLNFFIDDSWNVLNRREQGL